MPNNPIVHVFGVLLLLSICHFQHASASEMDDVLSKVQEAAKNQLQNLSEKARWQEPKFDVEVIRNNRLIPP